MNGQEGRASKILHKICYYSLPFCDDPDEKED